MSRTQIAVATAFVCWLLVLVGLIEWRVSAAQGTAERPTITMAEAMRIRAEGEAAGNRAPSMPTEPLRTTIEYAPNNGLHVYSLSGVCLYLYVWSDKAAGMAAVPKTQLPVGTRCQ